MFYQVETDNKKIRMVDCKKCGNHRKYHAKDLCFMCYNDMRKDRSNQKKDFQLM